MGSPQRHVLRRKIGRATGAVSSPCWTAADGNHFGWAGRPPVLGVRLRNACPAPTQQVRWEPLTGSGAYDARCQECRLSPGKRRFLHFLRFCSRRESPPVRVLRRVREVLPVAEVPRSCCVRWVRSGGVPSKIPRNPHRLGRAEGRQPGAPQMFARTDHDHVQRAGSQKSHVGTPDGIRTGRRRKGILAMPVNAVRDLDVVAAWGAWRQTGTGWCAEGTGPIRPVPPAFRTLQPLWRGDDERRWVSLTRRAILVETPSPIRRHRPAARLPAVAGVHSGVPGGAAGRGVSRRHRGDSRGVVGGPLNPARRTPPASGALCSGLDAGQRPEPRHATPPRAPRGVHHLDSQVVGECVDTTSANDLLHWMA